MLALAAFARMALASHVSDRVTYAPYVVAVPLVAMFSGFWPAFWIIAGGLLIGNTSITPGSALVSANAKQPDAVIFFVLISLSLAVAGAFQRDATLQALRSARRAEEAQADLKQNERLAVKRLAELETVYNQTPVGLCFLDADLRFVRINERLAEINRLPVEAHIGKTSEELFGEQSKEMEEICRHVLRTREPIRDRHFEISVEGEVRFFTASYDPVFAKDGAPLGVNVVVEETTEQKRAEIRAQLLAEATQMLNRSLDPERTLIELCESAVRRFGDWCSVSVLGEDGSIKCLAVKHIDPEKVKWAWELNRRFPPDPDAPTGVSAVIRTGKSEVTKSVTKEIIDAANLSDELREIVDQIGFTSVLTVPIAARGRVLGALTLVWAESKHHYTDDDIETAEELGRRAGIAIDNAQLYAAAQREIRERALVEEQVRRLNTELEQRVTERTAELKAAMEELEGFCYSVSHDLRAPMRSLSGNSRMLIEDYGGELNEDGRDHLQRIALAAAKMGVLVDDLLQFSRLGRTHLSFRKVNLSELANAAVSAYMAQHAESKAEVIIQPGMEACADPNVLALAMQNLVDNAIKYSSKMECPKVHVGSLREDGETIFFVRDNGVGFEMKYALKIFEPFQRLHRDAEYPGTGIGLANVRRVVQRHGGQIWAEAAPGLGATFYFTLCARCNEDSAPLTSTAPPYLG